MISFMATTKKKLVKTAPKKAAEVKTMKEESTCCSSKKFSFCFCKGILLAAVIVLVWVLKDPRIWVTILAGLALLFGGACMCKSTSCKK
jgi:hypothetical protein